MSQEKRSKEFETRKVRVKKFSSEKPILRTQFVMEEIRETEENRKLMEKEGKIELDRQIEGLIQEYQEEKEKAYGKRLNWINDQLASTDLPEYTQKILDKEFRATREMEPKEGSELVIASQQGQFFVTKKKGKWEIIKDMFYGQVCDLNDSMYSPHDCKSHLIGQAELLDNVLKTKKIEGTHAQSSRHGWHSEY